MVSRIKFSWLVFFLFFPLLVFSQHRNQLYNDYIKKYADMAMYQMRVYKVPASITLAQGLLESAAGRSSLARYSKNHFGIKCGGSWKGRFSRHDDDAKQECFRAYKSVKDSFEDHSLFLKKPRYSSLFSLDITDYKGWARGLKKCGYATNPSYANRLITIIEDYELYQYDRPYAKRNSKTKNTPKYTHYIGLCNDLAYLVAKRGDTFESLSDEVRISKRRLIRYNEVSKRYTISKGDIIYLHKKKKKAAKGLLVHVVKPGESMYLISQKYGIRLKYLYKMNRKDGDYLPEVGDRLRLR